MKITSPAFANNDHIPEKFTCKGENINPQLNFLDVPSPAKSLALIMHDPDAPRPGGFTHWVVYNIPPDTAGVPENSKPLGMEAKNDTGQSGYVGPCPPTGMHRYYFYLYVLDKMLDNISDKASLEQAMKGHILEQAELIGKFAK